MRGVLVVVVVAVLVSTAGPGVWAQSAPATLSVAGVSQPVEIRRDRWGINHIYAKTEADLFFAQGYAAAKDRLFQFELWRRQATGTLAEVVGKRELERDRGARLHMFRGDLDAELNHYHPRGKAIIEASTSTTLGSGCFTDTGDGTIHDTCTRLQWEKKDRTVDSGVDAENLHAVDNRYIWAGRCVYTPIQRCQPSLAAEIACKAQTDAADWWISGCEQCPGGEGNCTTTRQRGDHDGVGLGGPAEHGAYAGYSDWRLPSESGCNTCYTDSCTGCLTPSAHELETILLSAYPCGTSPCIDSIFGPTASGFYWSGSPVANSIAAWGVYFNDGYVSYAGPFEDFNDVQCVRAVRDGS